MKPTQVTNLVTDLGNALQSTQNQAYKYCAWQCLYQLDEHQLPYVHSYTETAIANLEQAYEMDPQNGHTIHHLAIAYHALAWELEQKQPQQATGAWVKALKYWHKLQTCASFWQELCAKGVTLSQSFDAQMVYTFRQNLMKYLLEIHGDFIHHYLNLQQFKEARRHGQIVRQAPIPPTERKNLKARLYNLMVTQTTIYEKEVQLLNVGIFLRQFANYIPALQTYLELTKQLLTEHSPTTQWEQIKQFIHEATSYWEKLEQHERLSRYPLAQVILGDLAYEIGNKYWVRARHHRQLRQGDPQSLHCEENQAYTQTVLWLKRAMKHMINSIEIQNRLINALLYKAQFTASIALQSDNLDSLIDTALQDCQDAINLDETIPQSRQLAADILRCCSLYVIDQVHLEYPQRLEKAEVYIKRAIEFDPENQALTECLQQIRKETR